MSNPFWSEFIQADLAQACISECSSRTIFHEPHFLLHLLGNEVKFLGGFKGEKLLCVAPIIPKNKDTFLYYTGPLWSNFYYSLPPYKRFSASQGIYNSILEKILPKSNYLKFQFPNSNEDIRAFDWWNYGGNQEDRFRINMRYSAIIENIDQLTDEGLLSLARSDDRRKSIRRALRTIDHTHAVAEDITNNNFISLYKQTMAKSNVTPDASDIDQLQKILSFSRENHGFILSLKKVDTGTIIASQLILLGNQTANAICQGVSSEHYSTELISLLLYKSILESRNRGAKVFDFNGANSPNRGDDKHSYGANPHPFLELVYG